LTVFYPSNRLTKMKNSRFVHPMISNSFHRLFFHFYYDRFYPFYPLPPFHRVKTKYFLGLFILLLNLLCPSSLSSNFWSYNFLPSI
jgi:hypothetical protein